jgi:hypothetical protein
MRPVITAAEPAPMRTARRDREALGRRQQLVRAVEERHVVHLRPEAHEDQILAGHHGRGALAVTRRVDALLEALIVAEELTSDEHRAATEREHARRRSS